MVVPAVGAPVSATCEARVSESAVTPPLDEQIECPLGGSCIRVLALAGSAVTEVSQRITFVPKSGVERKQEAS
jgi:hypothetical protein